MTTKNENIIEVGSMFLNLHKTPDFQKELLLHNLKTTLNDEVISDCDDYLFYLMNPEILNLILDNKDDLKAIKNLKKSLIKTINKLDIILKA